ncbi:MAG: helicase-related protein [Syntrophobacteraceae bacterium]|jgi:superfamily II DNA or RNA helicase
MNPASILDRLKPNVKIRGPFFAEEIQLIVMVQMGDSVKLIGKGLRTGQVHEPILSLEQLAALEIGAEKQLFDGDARRFRLGVEAMRLGLAYEYDPYFSLSIARIDPLPHQLEAVYDYFLKLPRIRFLLADDPGAGKTIMAGLLVKELKIRGLIQRILIVAPANLTFQWRREMLDKFREDFKIVRGDVLRMNYGSNPWMETNQAITSISWVSRIEDANESLLRSNWDLIIVDEAHKMSAYSTEKKTLAYRLGEALSERTDHYLLMTATPHKGDPQNFCLFLRLLDQDVYGDIKSLEEAIRKREAPFYLRRIKEALVTFPDPETGKVKAIFTKRNVKTVDFHIDDDELEFYDMLTKYVEDQSIKASEDDSARGRAMGFIMAMLQRRFASSLYAVRRSLERMKAKREKILADPERYRNEQIQSKLPDDFDELPADEQDRIWDELEGVVASVDPIALREDIFQLGRLIDQARSLEGREIESKLRKLKEIIAERGVFTDSKMKLLVFTEHKDTLDYLAGDGKDGRPLGKLKEWGLELTQIHGGMKIGDRDTPFTRIYAEREFREACQVLVATEAAGEGINLQFCWLMINYDIPWNPVRLEQRMGRIHRYGQEKDCLIFNFVATNTREGRVLYTLFDRIKKIEEDLDPNQTGKVFNVLGDIFPANQLEGMVRDMYSHNLTEEVILSRIVEQVDTDRLRRITNSTLEGLAKKELNLSAIIGKSEEAKERRLVPEVVEDFFQQAAPVVGIFPKVARGKGQIYRIGKVPKNLLPVGDRLETRFGRLGREYAKIVFDKKFLSDDPTLEWVTPGHPLFECVREAVLEKVTPDLDHGAVFFDINRKEPCRLDVFSAAIKDGLGNILHKRLFVAQTEMDRSITIRQPTIFLDMVPASEKVDTPADDDLPLREEVEHSLLGNALHSFLDQVQAEREKEIRTISSHMQISLNELIDKQNLRMAELLQRQMAGDTTPLMMANLKTTEDRLDELTNRLERRTAELEKERHCTIAEIRHLGRAWVLPHPERVHPDIAHMVQDEEIERIAVNAVIEYERSRGWEVESVETENRGFDLISRKLHPEDPKTAVAVKFIEVKGRAFVSGVALTANEFKTAERLQNDYFLYVVYNCATQPEVYVIQNPALLGWKPVVMIEHYQIGSEAILQRAVR